MQHTRERGHARTHTRAVAPSVNSPRVRKRAAGAAVYTTPDPPESCLAPRGEMGLMGEDTGLVNTLGGSIYPSGPLFLGK